MAENTEQKTFIVKNKRSSVFIDDKGNIVNAGNNTVIPPGSKPKLIPDNIDDSKFGFGEIAINFVEGLETIQLKNNKGNIATFQNEVLVIDKDNKNTYLDENGKLKKATTAKIVIDLTDESSGEGGSGVDSEYVTFITAVATPPIENDTLSVKTYAHLNVFELTHETDDKEYSVVIDGELNSGYEIITVINNKSMEKCKINMENGLKFDLLGNNVAQVAFISDGKNVYGRIL